MEYIIKNAKIATMDKENPFAESAIVKDGKFVGCTGMNWTFSLFDPVLKIGLLDTIYTVPEQYQMFLSDVDNYMHHLGHSSSSSSPIKYEHSCYDYNLRADFVEQIINASEACK